jgi:LacI family transcriptional regulator
MLAFKRNGVVIPAEISVIGFDDQPFAELVDPPLSTVRQPMARMGMEAFQILLAALKDPKAHQPQIKIFPSELVIRQSTAQAHNRSK